MKKPKMEWNEFQDGLPLIRRINYQDLVKGAALFQSAQVLFFGATVASAAMALFVQAAYILPTFMLFLFLAKFLSRGVINLALKVIPATKENRWTLNSLFMSFWMLPVAVIIPGALIFFAILFLVIPYGFIGIVIFNMDSSEVNLFMILYYDMARNATSFSDAVIKFFWWDSSSLTLIVLSIIKIAGSIFTPWFYYYGHQDVTKEEFLTSDADCELIFEKRY